LAVFPGETSAFIWGERAMIKASESTDKRRHGKVGWIILWLLGVPIPVLFILFLIRGCT
jgi:hypothetical protein